MTAAVLLLGLPLTAAALAGLNAWGRHTPDERRGGLLLALGGLLATAGFFWQLLFLPDRFVPVGGGDLASFLWPAHHFAARSLQSGVLPFWNPYLFAGSPFAADIQNGLFYPPNLLAWLVARPFTYRALELLAVGHFLVAVWGMTFCLRILGVGRLAALAGSVVFSFSGFMVAHLGHLNLMATAAWAPWAIGLLLRSLQSGSLIAAVGAGAVFGVALLAGHPQMAFLSAGLLVMAGLWGRWRGLRTGRPGIAERLTWARLSLHLALLFSVAIGVAAVQLVPFLELTGYSLRQTLTYAESAAFPLERRGLLLLLVPHFFGPSLGDFWGMNSLTESYGYLGIITAPLAALGVLASRGHPWRLFWLLLAVGGLLLSLGERTVLHGWLYELLPAFERLRVPGRFLFYVTVGTAVLAAFGFDSLAAPTRLRPALRFLLSGSRLLLLLVGLAVALLLFAVLTNQDKDPLIFRRTIEALESGIMSVVFLALGLATLWSRFRRPRRWLAPAMFALLVTDLFSANQGLNLTDHDPTGGFQHEAIAGYLKAQPGPFRIDPVTGIADRLQPDWSLTQSQEDVLGLFNPLALRDYQRYWENLGSRSNPAYDLLAARFLIGAKDVPLDRAKFEVAFTGHPSLNVYHNTAALPMAQLVPEAAVLPSDELWRRLREGPWDPRALLLAEDAPPLPASLPPTGVTTAGALDLLDWQRPTPNDLRLRVRAPGAGYLLIVQNYYPGWRAWVDGQLTPLFRADGVFQALALDVGIHEVALRFQPTAWPVALLASVGTWLMVLVLTSKPWLHILAATRQS